jgi:dTDP-4-amino-4,6-dideoxygalactose transaminase
MTGTGDLKFQVPAEATEPVYHLFVVRTEKRDGLREFLLGNGVETDVHYPVPPHLQKAFSTAGFSNGSFPETEKICKTILSLPLWPGMTDAQVSHVCKKISDFYNR